MDRKMFGLLAVTAIASTASAVTFHSGGLSGIGPAGDPNVVIETWDFGINMEDPDFWLSSSIFAEINGDFLDSYSFNPMQDGLEPPTNPVSNEDQFSTFFSTARHFPNDLENENAPNYDFNIETMQGSTIAMSFQGGPEDGVGPSFVIFRLAISRPAGSPRLTLIPEEGIERIASFSGQSETSIDGVTPFHFDIYSVPEPGTLLMAGCCALFILRRNRA